MNAFPPSLPAMDATPIATCDAMLAELVAARPRWVALSTSERAALLRRCMETTLAVSDAWASTACKVKGYAEGSNGHGEEYLGGTLAVMRNLRLFAEALEAGGTPPLPKVTRRADGQWVAQVFPQGLMDKVLFTGVTCDIWIEPGQEPTQGRIYRDKRAGKGGDGGVCVVLGAGNQSSIPPMDVLYKLVVDDEVCLLKMNPVNEQLGPVIEQALQPLVDAGFLRVVYGGIDVGKHLTDHPSVTSIHITGSAAAHDAILWGPGEEGRANKAAGTPRLHKEISSELGCVSPVLVVPGAWTDKELAHQARQVASMLAYNCGFNCNGARLIVVAKGWALRARFEEAVRACLDGTPTRKAYYPTAQATWKRFTEAYPHHADLGTVSDPTALPWTLLEGVSPDDGEFALAHEPWCGIMSFVDLDVGDDASAYLDAAVPFANDRCWGTLSINVLVDPRTEKALGARFDQAIADLRYGGIGINCWTGLNYGLVNATWGAFPGHPPEDIQSGKGVVHNGLLLDHPQKSVVRAPFVMAPTPAWFTDHKNNLALGRIMTRFEAAPSWFKVPGVAMTALKG
ncbi:MAG: aldehyde dehydrogenase family protein [Alphaproteobacteria bacterium]|nr:aldehyde dehydrogenase family protein [Alphaproteobacteria bacterium]